MSHNPIPLGQLPETNQSEPLAPPWEVKCTSPSSTSILVSWLPPPSEAQNGEITGYSITYLPLTDAGNGTAQSVSVNVSNPLPEASTFLLQGLKKWTDYSVSVSALNKAGAGPPSPAAVVRTEEDGMFPTATPVPSTPLTPKSLPAHSDL